MTLWHGHHPVLDYFQIFRELISLVQYIYIDYKEKTDI